MHSLVKSTGFVGAELVNVTFKNCEIRNSEIRNLENSKVIMEDSKLSDVSFFQSRLDLTVQNSKVDETIEFMGAQAGSSLTITDSTIGPYSDFSGSNFTRFEIRNSTIKDSRANGISAKEVVIDGLDSDFAIAGSTLQSIRVRDISGNFSLGRTKAVTAVFEDCKPDAEIFLNDFTAERLTLRKCNADELILDSALIKELTLTDMKVGWLVFDNLKVDTLSLHNVLIEHKLTAPNAMAKEVLNLGWRKQPNATIEAAGSNIPLP